VTERAVTERAVTGQAVTERAATGQAATGQAQDGAAMKPPWRLPTRRAFVAMLGAAAAALAVRSPAQLAPDRERLADDRPRPSRSGTTRWIGHC
jgi:hypothetical protein